MSILREFAPAKLNLYLNITGRRENGYHNLDSLAAFSSVGDELAIREAKDFSFEISGRFGEELNAGDMKDNLVIKATLSLSRLTGNPLKGHLVLIKNLPLASGIGGGSADAAATLRLLARMWGLSKDDERILEAAKELGEDVPVCLHTDSVYITAEGTEKSFPLPKTHVVLINPCKGVPTPAVYKAYREGNYPFSPKFQLENKPETVYELVAELKKRNNDLYKPALTLLPEISEIITMLEASDNCLFARMSGSGATCFGIYPDEMSANSAAAQIKTIRPKWWVEKCEMEN
ncbi:MAG: 4-(cytidine 5'-diphospho)-2-C-methyl-D-erythritol kinase [Alphaproteobacteria bacterium]|nr:4-(cytidine 5'-diphospho)-2-C-methyl-D-erythritol kinase [Alphaproteobacteria bacterium]MCL2505289.1 4-(cytidine 5'-diphospho)-2-C-methyl-D-erythritol kinase [Alphaproteobacteria bacterium]